MHNSLSARVIGGVATAAALGILLAACTATPGQPPATNDAEDQQSLYEQGIELAYELAGSNAEVAEQQLVFTPDYFGYTLTETALAIDEFSQREYLNNQLIIRTQPGTTPQQVADLVEPLGGTVVGINAALDDHQILLDTAHTVAELDSYAHQLASDPLVIQARPNMPFAASTPHAVDPVNDSLWQGAWGPSLGNGDGSVGNWGMQAIGAPVIWDIADELSPVALGVYDFFYHGQMNSDISEYQLYTVPRLQAPEVEEGQYGQRNHGMHVAGIMAAEVNNGTGVAGVAPTANLLAASYPGLQHCLDSWFGKDTEGEKCRTHNFAETLGFSFLLAQGAKVINYSIGNADELMAKAEQGDEKTKEFLADRTKRMSEDFIELIARGHDFLIVAAGGNESGGMSTDKDGNWVLAHSENAETETFDQAVDAHWNQFIAMSKNYPALRDRVISVGAMGSVREFGGQGYEVAAFSNYGTDLIAPGYGIVSTMEVFGSDPHQDIYSPHVGCTPQQCPSIRDDRDEVPPIPLTPVAKLHTESEASSIEPPELPPGYHAMSGTSMAAPHVAGVAGAIWSANPELTASQVRRILLNTAESEPSIGKHPQLEDDSTYPRLNAAAAIRDALASRNSWHDQRQYDEVPTALQGTWCQLSAPENCLNFADLLTARPQAEFDGTLTAVDPTGRTSAASTITLCLDGPCEGSVDAFTFTYYPPGAEWECVYHSELATCDSATRSQYLPAHDISWPRIVHRVKQDDGRVTDAEPFVLNLRAKGDFRELPFDADSARLPLDSRSYKGIPQEIQGTWCFDSDSDTCFNFEDFFSNSPDSGFAYEEIPVFPANEAHTFGICLAFDSEFDGAPSCSMAASVFFTYFPAGVSWDCVADGAARFGFESCDPDFTHAHRSSEPRLVKILNHQHERQYVDVEPMYLSPNLRGTFPDIHWNW